MRFSFSFYYYHILFLILYELCAQSHLPFCLGDILINHMTHMTVGKWATGTLKILQKKFHFDSM